MGDAGIQVMSRDLKTFRQVERVGVIYDTLLKTEHDCFPVVDPEQGWWQRSDYMKHDMNMT